MNLLMKWILLLIAEKELNKMKKFLEEMNFYESGNSILKGNFEVKENKSYVKTNVRKNPELYKSIKNEHLRGNPIQFNFFPSKQEIAERQKYFKEKRQKYPTRTIDRFYQDELVETLNKRFNQCLEKIANI